jgi:hypothetical protein
MTPQERIDLLDVLKPSKILLMQPMLKISHLTWHTRYFASTDKQEQPATSLEVVVLGLLRIGRSGISFEMPPTTAARHSKSLARIPHQTFQLTERRRFQIVMATTEGLLERSHTSSNIIQMLGMSGQSTGRILGQKILHTPSSRMNTMFALMTRVIMSLLRGGLMKNSMTTAFWQL